MIPGTNSSGVLPPFLPGVGPTNSAAMAPYQASIAELITEFGTSPERILLLKGLLDFREKLRTTGIHQGFQWINGSFLENCESTRGRPPNDIDLVTFARRPKKFEQDANWRQFAIKNQELFNRNNIKSKYGCDAFFVDLFLPPESVVSRSRFWFGLFSHQRSSYLWKGLVEISLVDDDSGARALLGGGQNAS